MSELAEVQNKYNESGLGDRVRAQLHVPLRAADAKRSVKNILEWNSYLPADCVKTMVRMGWDYST